MAGDLPRLKHFGWGREGEGMTTAEEAALLARYAGQFGVAGFDEVVPPVLEAIRLAAPRLAPPASLAAACVTAPYDRAAHAFGKSYPDTLRGLLGDYADAPDVVAYPADEADLRAVLDWAGGAGAQVIPFGAGSSVVGGVTPPPSERGTVTVDLRRLDRVREVDPVSRAARIEGGVLGPALEAQLRPHGLTLRHFPQSFEYSTLGGWIATRSGGHFASLLTHIDELVESVRVVSPAGVVQTRRLPGSGAGPSPERLFAGSEGVLGLITEAWVRLQARPRFRAGGAVRFPDLARAMAALRAISQAGLWPANCRVLDRDEARNTGAGDGTFAVMVLGFEGADHPLEAAFARALECSADHGGVAELKLDGRAPDGGGRGVADGVHPDAVCAGAHDRAGDHQRHVRDRDHLGPLRGVPCVGEAVDRGSDPGGDGAAGAGDVPDHACLSGRPGAVFHVPRARSARRADRAVAYDQAGGERRADRAGRDDHAPPCGRAGPSAVVRPGAAGAVRGGAARGEACAGSGWHLESWCADRRVALDRHDAEHL